MPSIHSDDREKIHDLEVQVVVEERTLNFFDRYLSIWVAVCIILGTGIGYLFPEAAETLGGIEVANVSLPVAIVLLLMMFPIMLKISMMP